MWTSGGAADDIVPDGFSSKIKWRLLKRWFAPEKTINRKLYSSLGPGGDETELGSWARFKRYLLRRWLPEIRLMRRQSDDVATAEIAEQGLSTSAPASLRYQHGTITELAKVSTPVAMADGEPNAVQQITTYGLQPHSARDQRKRSSSVGGSTPGRRSEERPSSRGSSGIMFEERNLSDTESDAGEGAPSEQSERARSGSVVKRQTE